MEGGLGESSYARNSSVPAEMFTAAQPALLAAIKDAKTELFRVKVVRIADMGCSSGPNTINAMGFVVDAILQKLRKESIPEPEFQVFFSDLKANDFNTLFNLIPHEQGRQYFYAAIPGSFYGRLFPCDSLHVAMSSIALHWLSKVPDVVLDKNSHAWNSGRVWVDHKSRLGALEAFQQQAHEDLCQFLSCRAQEVVEGGLLFLLLLGRREDEDICEEGQVDNRTEWGDGFQLAWEDLVHAGCISQDSLDSFNVPLVFRSKRDVAKAVDESASFKILLLEMSSYPLPNYTATKAKALLEGNDLDPRGYAFSKTVAWKAIIKGRIREHLGKEELVEELFKRMELKLIPSEPFPLYKSAITLAVLERKITN